MKFIKKNLAPITALLLMAFFIIQNYLKPISERGDGTPLYIVIFAILLILLILIYFKYYRKTQ